MKKPDGFSVTKKTIPSFYNMLNSGARRRQPAGIYAGRPGPVSIGSMVFFAPGRFTEINMRKV
jgi:hypothetical protein